MNNKSLLFFLFFFFNLLAIFIIINANFALQNGLVKLNTFKMTDKVSTVTLTRMRAEG